MDIRKHRTLFLLGGILIVLVLIYLALSSYQWDADEADSGEDSQIQVTDLGELSSFQFTDQSTGTGMSFVKEDGTWYMADDREIPLDQTYIDAMENTYASLTATRQIDEPDALSDYGLDSPAYTVQATDADGNTTTFSVGDAADEDYYLTVDSGSLTYTLYLGSDSGDGTRHVQVQDSDLVYLVSSDVLNNLLGIGNSTEE